MKATEVIARDHRAAEALFEMFKKVEGDDRSIIVKEIFSALNAHESMEDTFFYAALEDKTEGDDEVLDAIMHEQTELKLEVMSTQALEFLPGEHDDRIMGMMEKVLAHAQKEEREIFPKAERVMSAAELEALGNRMEPNSAVSKGSED